MPKDHWKNSTRKAMSLKRRAFNSYQAPELKKLRTPITVPAGTCVLVRKDGSDSFKSHTTTKQLHFTHFRAASKAALMFVHDGWSIWISKSAIGYK
jgi:hypothetical protein